MDAVRLKMARREFDAGGGFTFTFTPISVKVRNVAFAKAVSALYTPDGTTWKDLPLSFSSHFGDYDTFDVTVNEQVVRFAIRYSAAGQTFFDNNGGFDYRLGSRLKIIGGNVALHRATAKQGTQVGGGFVFTTSWFEGEILVNNLAFAKNVGVRMTADDGANWFDVPAAFFSQSTSDGLFLGPDAEVWRFKTPELNLNTSVPSFRFAVFYHDPSSGLTFWDNNFFQDYKLNKGHGSVIS